MPGSPSSVWALALQIKCPQPVVWSVATVYDSRRRAYTFEVVDRIYRENGMNPALFAADTGKVVALVAAWYIRNRLDGEPRRPLVERLLCGANSSIEEFVIQ